MDLPGVLAGAEKLLREALFTSVGWSKLDVPSVGPNERASERASDERIIIQTTGGPQRGGHMPLNSETLKPGFRKNVQKRVKVGLDLVDSCESGSVFGRLFVHF